MNEIFYNIVVSIEPVVAIISIVMTVSIAITRIFPNINYTNLITKINSIKNETEQGIFACESVAGWKGKDKTSLSFENLHLSSYYTQTLAQSKISFWFSLIFASLGFTLIIVAVVLHSISSLDKTIITIVSGVIIDAISALFFVQSNNAQKAVGVFFEKLRKDKQIYDAKKLADTIDNHELKDRLKAELSLQLLGIANSKEVTTKIVGK